MIELVFWAASFLVVYPYLVYPGLLYVLARRGRVRALPGSAQPPKVTLIISAYNEDGVIESKLDNALALNYPAECLEILVVSDASTDRTDELVRGRSALEPRIQLVRQDERRGKSAGLNRAIERATGQIVVFSDANAIYDVDSVAQLVGCFADERVGYAVGAALYHDANANRAAQSEGMYWKLELFLKQLESDFGSIVGGDGALYAARRRLIRPLMDDDISDFVTPLQIIAQGYRGKFNPKAVCYEKAGESFAKEFGRKRRIVNRSWRAYRRYAGLLRPSVHGRFLFMLLSHKVVRWFGLPLIAVAWLANTALLATSHVYWLTWAGITASVLVAVCGALLDSSGRPLPRVISPFYYFYYVNLAGALGIWDEWRGVRHVTWDHIRKQQP
jgi:cellulose synthase/poly-beta-1,6-N-acetylglucosamine synthase-like glycosyltransferase